MVTTKSFSKIWNNILSLTKLKLRFPHTLNLKKILQGELERQTKMAAFTEL